MQIYAVAHKTETLACTRLLDAVRAAAAAVPGLADGPACVERSRSRALEVAAISHGAAAAAPRNYRARAGDAMVLFDGLPIARDGSFPAHDARALLHRWDDAADTLTGLFSAVRIDFATDSASFLLDALGLTQVFIHRRGDAWVVSNSVEAIRVLMGLDSLDAEGVSYLLSIGWVMGGRTLLAGVEELAGGHVHRLNGRSSRASPYLTTGTLAALRRKGPPPEPASDLAERLKRQAVALSASGPIRCGVTAGRDTRVLVGLLDAAGVDAEYYTVGAEEALDVEVARELVAAIGAPHKRTKPVLPLDADRWLADTARYIAQTDGMANLTSIGDWRSHEVRPGPLGVRMWGMAGEIGRGGVGIGTPATASVAGLRSVFELQRRLVLKRLGGDGGIVAPAALDASRAYLDAFLADRRAEGWPVGEVGQAFYTFERIGQWAASGLRRTLGWSDQYSPFLTRDFIEYAFTLPPGDRYLEAAHYRLLSCYNPTLRDMRFEIPWRPQRAEAAARLAVREATARVLLRSRKIAARKLHPPAPSRPTLPHDHFSHEWFEAGVPQHRELVASHRDSAVWEFADRRRVERLLAASPVERWPSFEGLNRVLTVLWYLHGPRDVLAHAR